MRIWSCARVKNAANVEANGIFFNQLKPIATPTFGGMISSTIYVLFLIPCLFAIGEDIRRRWPERFAARYAAEPMTGES